MSYQKLSSHPLEPGISYHRSAEAVVQKITLDSPALDVMTDLKKHSASTIHARDSIADANDKMKQRGVRLLLVVDISDSILGLISATDILGERPLQHIQKHGGQRKDIQVKDIMTGQNDIEVLQIKDVSRASVGDVVETLRYTGHQHAVVVDNQGWNNAQTVRGIISLNQIARQLGLEIRSYDIPQTLSEIAAYKKNEGFFYPLKLLDSVLEPCRFLP